MKQHGECCLFRKACGWTFSEVITFNCLQWKRVLSGHEVVLEMLFNTSGKYFVMPVFYRIGWVWGFGVLFVCLFFCVCVCVIWEPAECMLTIVFSCNWCPGQVTAMVYIQRSGSPQLYEKISLRNLHFHTILLLLHTSSNGHRSHSDSALKSVSWTFRNGERLLNLVEMPMQMKQLSGVTLIPEKRAHTTLPRRIQLLPPMSYLGRN